MNGSLGSGSVTYDPDKRILHFGSPAPEPKPCPLELP